jgi:hypothetical protein
VPTLDLAVLVKGDGGDGSNKDAFVGGKDYLNHRYTDVSFFFYCCDPRQNVRMTTAAVSSCMVCF